MLVIAACVDVVPEAAVLVQVAEGDGEKAVAVLEGVEVCQADTENCVETDSNGEATLLLPAGEEVSYTVTKKGYEPQLWVDVTDEGYVANPRPNLWRNELTADWYRTMMSQYPLIGGAVFLDVGFEGATFELVDATGKAFYLVSDDDNFQASLELDATTSNGAGGFLEVAPGEFQIEIGGTASGCVPGRAWPGDSESRIRFPVRAGYLTSLHAICSRP